MTYFTISRPINGITLNGDEDLIDDDGDVVEFATREIAEELLRKAGYSELDGFRIREWKLAASCNLSGEESA